MTATPPLERLMDQWVSGWSLCRGIPVVRTVHGWRVEVRNEERDLEDVVLSPDLALLAELADVAAGNPRHWVTMIDAPAARRTTGCPGLRLLASDESLMTCSQLAAAHHPDTTLTDEENRAMVAIIVDGTSAASGTVAVIDGVAVFDRIRTSPDFRRRGYGRQVMSALSARAIDHGARTGVLAATVDGQGLYRSIGWQDAGSMATLCGDRVHQNLVPGLPLNGPATRSVIQPP